MLDVSPAEEDPSLLVRGSLREGVWAFGSLGMNSEEWWPAPSVRDFGTQPMVEGAIRRWGPDPPALCVGSGGEQQDNSMRNI